MTKSFFQIAFLFSIISYPLKVCSQVDGLDSLQKKILESVQKKLDKKGVSKYYDTGSIFNGQSPVNLNHIFDELHKSLSMAKSKGDIPKLKGGYYNLSAIDSSRGNYKGAYENYKMYTFYQDSLRKIETEKKEMQYEFDKKQAIAKAEQEKKDAEQKRAKNVQYFTIAGLITLLLVILLVAFIQWRNNQQKKKDNNLLQQKNAMVESAMSELKSTQTQLIHREKMASLGELTAGIAHEIQNPLNFVNNFSEVNRELIAELQEERNKTYGARDEKLETDILNDLKENEEKINHHGKRADAIVKGMLQHSRSSSGQKEATDVNVLCDEFLRLSYHGIRAKDKSFHALIKTDFDSSINKVNIIPEDIGRVILNLLTNAFYAVNEKAKMNIGGFEPTVIIQTKKINDKVFIHVSDNGNGIPNNIVDKIFQPFFTTKPTGEGTGLGLSLSYDIIKAHGGELSVNTKEGEFTEFTCMLPGTA